MGVRSRSARVGVAPSRSRSEGGPSGDHNDGDDEICISSDEEHRHSSFLSIPVKNTDLKEKLLVRRNTVGHLGSGATTGVTAGAGAGVLPILHSQRKKQEQRERRRSSVLQSLAMLDVMGEDDSDSNTYNKNCGASRSDSNRAAHADAEAELELHAETAAMQLSRPQGRYLRRGSVTKHRLQPDVSAIQPTPTATPTRSRTPQDEIDYYGYASDSYGYTSDTNDSHSHAHALKSNRLQQKNKDSRRSSLLSSEMTPSDALQHAQTPPITTQRTRYPRRGSVTRHKLQAEVDSMQPTSHHHADENDYGSDLDYGYNDDNASVASMPPLSSSATLSSDALPPRQRYSRRGSVTKFSLDQYLQKPDTGAGRPKGQDKTNRSGLEMDYGYNDDNASVVSLPPLSSSASFSSDALPTRQRYLRRGSVTKFSLDQYMQKSETGTAGLRGQEEASRRTGADSGYSDDNASIVSMPPLSSSASFSSDALPPRQRYLRRGSVTKFSLNQSHKPSNNTGDLQPDYGDTTQQTSACKVATAAVPSKTNFAAVNIDGEEDSDSDIDDRRKPKLGDDDYSENLEDSGRFARRSIHISSDGDDEQLPNIADSKRPPLPRALSGTSNKQSKVKKKPTPSKHPKNELEDDSDHTKKRMTTEQEFHPRPTNNLKKALEDDSGHIKKSWYSQPAASRRDSVSSIDSESSDAEFGLEIVEPQPKPRSPPKLPPSMRNTVGTATQQVSPPHSRASCDAKTTIDGNISTMSSSSLDDLSSHTGLSDDEDEVHNPSQAFQSKKRQLRARRSSIVGIPSNDSGYSSLDEISSHLDEEADAPKKTKMRARRSSIVGIPSVDPSVSPNNPGEAPMSTKPTLSGHGETVKNKKKVTTKTSTKTKKASMSHSKARPDEIITMVGAANTTTNGRRGCMKSDNAVRLPKKVRFGHLVITEFPIILGE